MKKTLLVFKIIIHILMVVWLFYLIRGSFYAMTKLTIMDIVEYPHIQFDKPVVYWWHFAAWCILNVPLFYYLVRGIAGSIKGIIRQLKID